MVELRQQDVAQRSVGNFFYHWTARSGPPRQLGSVVAFPFDLTAGFHDYSLRWDPEAVTIAVDGVRVLHVVADPGACIGVADRPSPDPVPIHDGPLKLIISTGVGTPACWAGAPAWPPMPIG